MTPFPSHFELAAGELRGVKLGCKPNNLPLCEKQEAIRPRNEFGELVRDIARALRISVVIALMALIIGSVRAADLNAPAEKKSTIGSELIRGYNVTLTCEARYWDTFYECIETAIAIENRKNTDTDAVLLGVYGGAIVRLTKYEDKTQPYTPTNGSLALSVGKGWYYHTMALQHQLNISDQQLADIIRSSTGYLNKVELRWGSP